MAISQFPVALQPIIQQNFLQRLFWEGLQSNLGYRAVAETIVFPNNIGETFTSTKRSSLSPALDPLAPASNTGLDNGLTPVQWAVEQFTLSLSVYANTMDLDIFQQHIGIVERFTVNAVALAEMARKQRDRLAYRAIMDAYMSGNTTVTTTLGSPGTTLAVDDIRGFRNVIVGGIQTAVGVSNTLAITVNGVAAVVIGATADVTNVSSVAAFGGISGTLTTQANVSVANGTAGNIVASFDRPTVLRANDRTKTASLVATDYLTMNVIIDAVSELRSNNVPTINGAYNLYLNEKQINGLFRDADFRQWHQGLASGNVDYSKGVVNDLLGVRIIRTTEGNVQVTSGVPRGVQRAVLCGAGALYEADYAGTMAYVRSLGEVEDDANIDVVDGVVFVTREPLDRLKHRITQSYFFATGFVAPTDVLTTSALIPTASAARYKRAVVIESA